MEHKMKAGRHLDLGCGKKPRNPYGYDQLFGIDIVRHTELANNVDFRLSNLTMEPIPYPAGHFDAVSAFDFIEHIPRILPSGITTTRFPFIELMNEIWRVLKPDGTFYALTPAYPGVEAFQDPTHVNIITDSTHEYFCGDDPYARNYGFKGKFAVMRAEWIDGKNANTADWSWRKTVRGWHRTVTQGKKTHFLWELRALK
ncbi:MAG TPA: class I SAM-dependent methyltransferase [Methylophilaceae bacterium]|jgi:SAM-dependent methyltransferase